MSDRNLRIDFCLPGYKWCGPGCSGPGAPVNRVDACCMMHDKCYERLGPTKSCDRQFLNCLRPKMNTRTKAGRDAALIYSFMKIYDRYR